MTMITNNDTFEPTYKWFPFQNSFTKDRQALMAAFLNAGLNVEDVQYEMLGMMTWVLAGDGSLWLHDKSNGGGGRFTREAKG